MLLLAAFIASLHQQGLECSNPTAQLFAIEVELLAADSTVIFSTQAAQSLSKNKDKDLDTAPAKICSTYPVEVDGDKWGTFDELSTVQYVIPPTAAGPSSVASIRFISNSTSFALLYQENEYKSTARTGDNDGASVVIPYPAAAGGGGGGGVPGSPAHATLFRTDPKTSKPLVDKAMAVFISFSKPEASVSMWARRPLRRYDTMWNSSCVATSNWLPCFPLPILLASPQQCAAAKGIPMPHITIQLWCFIVFFWVRIAQCLDIAVVSRSCKRTPNQLQGKGNLAL